MGTAKQKGSKERTAAVAPKSGKRQKPLTEKKKLWRAADLETRRTFRKELASKLAPLAAAPARATNGERPGLDDYTEDLGQRLFAHVVTGNTLRTIAGVEGMPPLPVLLRWIGNKEHPFHTIYHEAKKLMVPFLEEQALEIAATPLRGTTVTTKAVYNPATKAMEQTTEVKEHDAVDRSRLAFDAYKWVLGFTDQARHGKQLGEGEGDDNLRALLDQFRARSEEEGA